MRRIGNLADQTLAKRFCDYLLTVSIEANADPRVDDPTADPVAKTWDIWIRDEKDVDQAREELARFQENPNDERFKASADAGRIRDKKAAEDARRAKKIVQRPKWSDSGATGNVLAGAAVKQQGIPVTIGIIVLSVVCGFAANFNKPQPTNLQKKIRDAMAFVEPSEYASSGRDPFASLRKGEVWRVLTPMFMHGDEMHVAFNMLMIYFLGAIIERLHGSLFLAALVIVTHLAGVALQVLLPGAESMPWFLERLAGSPMFVGASGAVYGLFGFLWLRPRFDASYPVRMVTMNVVIILGWLVFCMLPIFDLHIANGAHLGGLLAGMAIAPILSIGQTR